MELPNEHFNFKDHLRKLRPKNLNTKNSLMALTIIVLIACIGIILKVDEVKTRAFSIKFGGEDLGTVRDREVAEKLIEQIEKELASTYDVEIVLDKKIEFVDTHAKDEEIITETDLRKNIRSKLTFLVSGYVLQIDGKDIGAFKTKKEADELLYAVKSPYIEGINENSNIEEVTFVEDVKVVKKDIPMSQVKSLDEVKSIIATGTTEEKTHIVEEGESYWTIAAKYNMTVDELISANPGKDPEKIYLGDEVSLIVPKPLITIATVEEVQYEQELAYETKIEQNTSMYKNEKKVKVKGVKGKSNILAKVTKHNGVEVERKIIKEEIVSKPVDELIVKGTKKLPLTAATGAFILPTRGSLSSRYGMRRGRMHKGIDLAARIGTPINAADGGTVTFAGYRGAYGYLVEVNHGNGFVTRYGHCSKIYVKKGTKVYKGQKIAAVGNTGRSTGPHLHFEVLKNGVHQNPSKYVGK
ncbi:M23 family metallopeptidase [Anaerosalibacter sp. Marseille-P3206]|uniref:M23 family metallopeptidase n=1 Tax=Anaerosalibacter sp. Marseille-P3206 TaxID=1871005 RepID=UPI000984C48F|nr:M23 family metallopeptidase [Anaerosalibacter sp. Marseille-P3206]